MRFAIPHYTATSGAGTGLEALDASIRLCRSGLRKNDFPECDLDTWIGRVDGVEALELPGSLAHLDSRNNRLAMLGLQQDGFRDSLGGFINRFGRSRIGILMGTSTSSIGQTEAAYRAIDDGDRLPEPFRQPQVHNPNSAVIFLAGLLDIRGPGLTISTACSSSAKVFARAAEWLQAGLVDACLVGGVDSLCLSVLYGFNSLELLSSEPCRPFDTGRSGINIAEAAGYALLTLEQHAPESRHWLIGHGESSDAHHMSHPHPEGKGAALAMEQALGTAGLEAAEVGYINSHGTASRANDLVENLAIGRLFQPETALSSTKGWTGHALGAAGILESVITLNAMRTGQVPGTLNCGTPDPECSFPVLLGHREQEIRYAMSNSFGFGGSNASLLFEHPS